MFDYKSDTNNLVLLTLVSVFLLVSPLLVIMDMAIVGVYVTLFIAILGFAMPELRNKLWHNFKSLYKLDKLLLIVIFVSIILSTIFSKNSFYILYFGSVYEAMGALYWFSIIFCALLFKKNFILFIKSRIFSYLVIVSIVVSTLIMLINVLDSVRNVGILLQATSMGIWALFSLVIFVYQYINEKQMYWLVFALLSLINLIATQSRIAYILLFILIIYAIINFKKISRTLKILILSILLIFVLLLPLLSNRYSFSGIVNDQMYRIDLLNYSISQSAGNIFGVGASSGGLILNDVQNMSESLKITHNEGYLFDSSHNIFIDFMIFFGPVSAIAFAVLTIRSIFYSIKYKQSLLIILFVILLVNGLFNVTNILLTTLLLFFIVSFLPTKKVN